MLKHVNLSDPANPRAIRLMKKEGKLLIETFNLKSSGINDNGLLNGLSNLAQRLTNSYQDKGKLVYTLAKKNNFSASVSIPFEFNN